MNPPYSTMQSRCGLPVPPGSSARAGEAVEISTAATTSAADHARDVVRVALRKTRKR